MVHELTKSVNVQNFLENSANKQSEIHAVLSELYPQMNDLTIRFLNVLTENKRTNALQKIAETYLAYYKLLNKEEAVRVISASELNEDQKSRVLQTLQKTYEGLTFTMKY